MTKIQEHHCKQTQLLCEKIDADLERLNRDISDYLYAWRNCPNRGGTTGHAIGSLQSRVSTLTAFYKGHCR